MAQSKVNRDNYIVIQGWMLTDLNLKGNELIVYACIYGFSQAENQVFNGSLKYLADWTNSTKQGVMKNLKSLEEKGYIVKNETYINGVKFCEYYATKLNTLLNRVEGGMQQSLTGGSKQSLPNNISLNNKENNIDNNKGIYICTAEGDYLGIYKNIKLKETELAKLNEEYGTEETQEAIEHLSEYIELKGYKAKSHYLALRKWVFKAVKEERIKERELEQREKRAQEIGRKQALSELKDFYGNGSSFDADDFFNAALERSYAK